MTLINRAAAIAGGLAVLFLSVTLAHRQMKSTKMLTSTRDSLGSELHGTVGRPFAYRVLVPMLLHAADVLPGGVVDAAEARLSPLASANLPEDAQLDVRPIYADGLFAILTLALLAYALLTSASYQRLFDVPAWFRPVPQVLALLAIIPFMGTHRPAHTYDFVVLATWAALLYALVTERQLLFLLVLVVGSLNKETTILAVLPWALVFRDRLPRRQVRAWLVAQLALAGLAQGVVHLLRHGNPGAEMEHALKLQLEWLVERSFTDFAAGLVLAALVFHGFRDRPVVLRRAAALLIPLTALFIVSGFPTEVRVFYEALPVGVALAARNLQGLLASAFVPAATQAGDPRA